MPLWRAVAILTFVILLLPWTATQPVFAQSPTTQPPSDEAQACPVHVVKRGDTLRRIAERYLGARDRSPQIYALNRGRIGANADLIEPGMRLRIPCAAPQPQVADAKPLAPKKHLADLVAEAARENAPVTEAAEAEPPEADDPKLPRQAAASAAGLAPLPARDVREPSRLPGRSIALKAADTGPMDGVDPQPVAGVKAPPTPPEVDGLGDASPPIDEAVVDAAVDAAVDIPVEAPVDTPVDTAIEATVDVASETSDTDQPEQVTDTSQSPEMATEIFVLTGAPYLPFIDPQQPGGGMVTELILAAFAETDGPPLNIGFVNDRPAHLDIILPRGGFAFSFPWLIPDCTQDDLTPKQSAICTRYHLSDSLYEHVTEFYTLAESDFQNVRVPGDLAGAVICRPAGYPFDDLVAAGLLPDRIELVFRRTPEACIVALDMGEVDIASLDATLARAIVTRTNPQNPILVLEELTRIERLHAIALADDPAGREAVERLNAGLAILVETGLWYQIVNRYLQGTG